MSQDITPAEHPNLKRLKDAAYERWQEDGAERERVRSIVIGEHRSYRLGDLTKVGDDYVAEVIDNSTGQSTWTSVVGGEKTHRHWLSPDMALLHLLAVRRDPNPNTSPHAATYAARVLGIPADQS